MNYCPLYWEDIRRVAECIPNLDKLFGREVLITGSTGLICSAVTDLLFYLNNEQEANIKIILLGRSKQRIVQRFHIFEESKDYTFLYYDATSTELADIVADYVIHGASNADPQRISDQPVETMLSNIVGLNTLFQRVKNSQRFLYISSSEVYGKKTGSEPYKEDDYYYVDILNPRASYPSSKRAAETLCAAYGREYGRDVVIVRPGHVYGPTATESDSRASSLFPRQALAGQNIVMKSKGEQLRSYCYCLDCASAILSTLLNGERGNAYNISNKSSLVSIRQMAQSFADAGNVNIIFDIPTEAEKTSYNLMDNSTLDSSKIESLGWRAVFSMEEGAAHTLQIMLNK
jgi:nucleoside-diphosphate-sugar epimerase